MLYSMYVCVYVCMSVCVCVCLRTFTCIHIYMQCMTHTYTFAFVSTGACTFDWLHIFDRHNITTGLNSELSE